MHITLVQLGPYDSFTATSCSYQFYSHNITVLVLLDQQRILVMSAYGMLVRGTTVHVQLQGKAR